MAARGRLIRRAGVWWLRWAQGTRWIEESSGGPDREAAALILTARIRQSDLGLDQCSETVGAGESRATVTLGDARRLHLDDCTMQGRRSIASIRSVWAMLLSCLGTDTRLEEITAEQLRRYAAQRIESGASSGTVRNELIALKRAFRLYIEIGRVDKIPTFPHIKASPPRQGFFEPHEYQAIRKELCEHLRPLLDFYFLTGWRLREALGLQWSAVNWGDEILRLEGSCSKNSRAREWPFRTFRPLRELLRTQHAAVQRLELIVGRVIPWIFPRPTGDQIKDFGRAWKAACRRAGYPGRLVHDCRRTAVRNLVRAGVSRRVAMRLTGHETESVFGRYDITDDKDIAEATERYERYLAGRPS